MAELTGKPRPQLLLSADRIGRLAAGHHQLVSRCAPLERRAVVQESFIASTRQPRSWEEVFLSVDGIVCSGGNTLNQQAIWKAQGIDVDPAPGVGSRHRARRRQRRLAVLVRGGDDRLAAEGAHDRAVPRVPQGQPLPALRREPGRRPLYQKLIGSGADEAGLRLRQRRRHLLRGQRVKRVVADARGAKVYYVSVVDGKVVEKVMEPERIA